MCLSVRTRFNPHRASLAALPASRSHPFAAMYKFHVRYIWFPCLRLAFSQSATPTNVFFGGSPLSLGPCCPLRRSSPPRVLSVSLSFHIYVAAHTWRVCVSNYLPPFPFVALRFSFEGHVRFHKRVGVALNPPANRTRISAFLLLYPIFASFSCFHVRT